MPYVVKKSGSGYKVFKKGSSKSSSKKPLHKSNAEAQQKALYASETNESLVNEEHLEDALVYKRLVKYPKASQFQVHFGLESGKDVLFTLVYSAGETMGDVDYIETQVTDVAIPSIEIFEDPQSEEAKAILSRYGLSGDDIENAGQEGYEPISKHTKPAQETLEDSLQFEKYAVSILKSEKKS